MNFFRPIARHAASVLMGQFAVIGFGVADTVMTGRYSSPDLAALSVGFSIYISIYVGLMGIIGALLPVVGQLYGAQKHQEVGAAFRQGLYLAIAVSIPGVACLLFPDGLLQITQTSSELNGKVREYLIWLAWGFPAAVVFRVYATFNQAISRPLFVTGLQVGGLMLKVPLNILFMQTLGFGVAGCAMATTAINVCFVLVGWVVLLRVPAYRVFDLFARWDPPHRKKLGELLRLGLPMGMSYFFEVTATTFMGLFIARLGETVLAGHQIIVSIGAVIYMIPLSMSIATSAVVSQLLGAQRRAEALKAGHQGIAMSMGISAGAGLMAWLLQDALMATYTFDPQVAAVAKSLIIFIALYQVADSAQVTTAFVLRAYKIATLPTVLYAVSLWGVGLGGGVFLGLMGFEGMPLWLKGAAGFWFANALSLALVAVLFTFLLHHVARKNE
jgi:MATE family multidrug resistance protein